jgi:transcriptional regulator with GAF, ATPase, and Fis domain
MNFGSNITRHAMSWFLNMRWRTRLAGAESGAESGLRMAFDIAGKKPSVEMQQASLAEVRRVEERLEAENAYLRQEVAEVYHFGGIFGSSDAISSVFKQADQVARTDTTVLILGETGTGKELLARAVHSRSRRSERPLVRLNCAALPASLVESELFGHEKGAFTGANAKRIGRFELADNGTIFLDEIGELPLELQSKLLRVLQEGEFERVGSSQAIKADVRVIAATNRNLNNAVRDKKFREDLYFRLNVYPIQMPPLRERKDDIGVLALAFLAETSRRLGRPLGLPATVVTALQQYDWPGNVRELQNVVERAAVVSNGPMLELPDEWAGLSARSSSDDRSAVLLRARTAEQDCETVTLEQLEKQHIIRVLQLARWRIEGARGAASILGLKPSTLRSRMRRLGIQRSV